MPHPHDPNLDAVCTNKPGWQPSPILAGVEIVGPSAAEILIVQDAQETIDEFVSAWGPEAFEEAINGGDDEKTHAP